MKYTKRNLLPPLLARDKKDSGKEAIQDFFLAWTLRCAAYEHRLADYMVYEYARRIVYVLIHGDHAYDSDHFEEVEAEGKIKKINWRNRYRVNGSFKFTEPPADFVVTSVTTYRQEDNIDLHAEVVVENNGIYILNIENKFYSGIRKGQLESAKAYLKNKYQSLKVDKFINLVIHCDETNIFGQNKKGEAEALRNRCRNAGYKFPDIYTIALLAGMREGRENMLTGNDLFDEYWFRGYESIE